MKNIFLIVITATLLVSCDFITGERIKGSGNVVTEERTVSGFTGLDVSGAIRVELWQDAAYSVKVEADDNLQEYVEVTMEGSRLRVKHRSNTSINPSKRIVVHVYAPVLKSFDVSGASSIKGNTLITSDKEVEIDLSGASSVSLDVKAPKVDIEMSGASNVTLKGETRDVSIEGSGSIDVEALDLLAENVKVDISGASSVKAYASVKLDASLSGASSVRYRGNAAISSHTSGASSIKKIE